HRRINQILKDELAKAPADPGLFYELGRLLFENERKKEAVHWLYEALKFDSNHRQAHELLARYYQEIGDTKGAEIHQRMRRWQPPDSLHHLKRKFFRESRRKS